LSLIYYPDGQGVDFQKVGLAGALAGRFLIKYFGQAGALIIAAGLAILSSFVATEFLILPFLGLTGKGLFSFWGIFPRLFAGIFSAARRKVSARKSCAGAVRKKEINTKPKEEPPKPLFSPLERAVTKPKIINLELPKKTTASYNEPVVKKVSGDYKLPGLDLLDSPPPLKDRQIREDLEASSRILEDTLRDFGVEVRITQVSRGPVITRYELEPAPGLKVHRIVELSDDIALAMKASSVRIVAPIPGKARVGVEVPNSQSTLVYLKEILETTKAQREKSKLSLAIGKDISGQPLIADLADMPHLLIAGTTGSGKTVCVNSIITSMLFNATADEIKFLMVDPKMVEMAVFNDLPHLLCPVLTDPKKVSVALGWVVNEMEERYKLLAKVAARNIAIYNEKISSPRKILSNQPDGEENPADARPLEKMPYIIVIIDELADLMVVASQEIEEAITRLAQLSRAVGIHLILATQRPSVDVITGVIKANFPARISFRVASRVDSRTVLDMNGADKLLGKGDLLFLKPGQPKPIRAQGTLISDPEIERIVEFIKAQKASSYDEQLMEAQKKKAAFSGKFQKDELFDEAVRVILQTKQASVSMLQRRLGLGYTRAARLIDMMEEEGIVGPYCGSKPREILIEKDSSAEKEEIEI
ncbi:MAG: DNA translocase FtsK, partial [Candidatus Omnitrophota bacterium]